MKKLMFLTVIAFIAIGTVFAQSWGGASQPVTVNGTLELRNGQIAIADGNTAYFVPTLGRYIGFIDNLKEGRRVSVEGYAWGNYIEPSKVTIDGKSYDLSSTNFSQGQGGYGYGPGWCGGWGPGGGMMGYGGYGRGGYGHHRGRW